MRPDHVVVLNDSAHVNGGAAQVGLSSALALAQDGLQVTVISAVGPVAPELVSHENVRVLCLDQHDILHDPNRMRAIVQGLWNQQAANLLSRELSHLDASKTIVHVHGWSKALSASVLRAAVANKFPTVLTLHDYFVACPNGSFFNHKTRRICTLRPLSLKCAVSNCDSRSYSQKVWRLGRQALQESAGGIPRSIKHFITISELSRDVLRTFLPRQAKLHTVDNPVQVEVTEPVDVTRNNEFVYVGRFSKEKGPELFARAAAQLDVPATFIGAGDCAEAIREIYPRAVVTGWLDHSEMLRRLRKARVLVVPSLWYETYALVVAEAAALGVPAIVPDTSAARERIIEGVTGLTFRGGSLEDLVAKMQAFRDPLLAAALGRAARQRFWQRPAGMAEHVRQLHAVYEEVLRSA
ncbi:MAG TPA: glycosyltransferase [Candidatus Acidoferrales bacterium]|nr:glycosyltransferase [Candidatus Acidoferrales bacterium]